MAFTIDRGECEDCGGETVLLDEYRFTGDSDLEKVCVEQCRDCGYKSETPL